MVNDVCEPLVRKEVARSFHHGKRKKTSRVSERCRNCCFFFEEQKKLLIVWKRRFDKCLAVFVFSFLAVNFGIWARYFLKKIKKPDTKKLKTKIKKS